SARQRQFGMRITPKMGAALEQALPADFRTPATLDDAVRAVGDRASLNVYFNWRAIEPAGGKREAAVRVSIAGMKVGDAVLAVLRAQRPPLACAVDDEVLTIST